MHAQVRARLLAAPRHRSGLRPRRTRVLAQGGVRAPLDKGQQGGPSSFDLYELYQDEALQLAVERQPGTLRPTAAEGTARCTQPRSGRSRQGARTTACGSPSTF